MQQEFAARVLSIGSTFRTLPGVQHSRPEWQAADVAVALSFASPNAAACWRWRYVLDRDVLPQLRRLLTRIAAELRVRERWPDAVDDARLVALILLAEAWPAKQRTPTSLAAAVGVLPSRWRREWQKPHARLAAIFDVLVGDAERVLARRLGGLTR